MPKATDMFTYITLRGRASARSQTQRPSSIRFKNPDNLWTDLDSRSPLIYRIDMSKSDMSKSKSDVPHGSLDLLILRTLDTMGRPLHGYSIARRIEQVAGGMMRLSQGSIYPALIRLEQRGWIRTKWGTSETNRKVKFYELTRTGAKQLRVQIANWEQSTALLARFLTVKP
jgi:PadR family transcriptional regulator PadR